MQRSKTPLLIFVSVVALAGSFTAGAYAGYALQPEDARTNQLANTDPLTEASAVDFAPFWETWNLVDERFAPASSTTAVGTQEKVWGAIGGLVDSLDDPYSVFLPPDDAKIFAENISGSFGGVGMEIGIRDDMLTVISPLKGTPAERAGLQAGDSIIAVNEESTARMSVDEAVKIIRGEVGTDVELTIAREGEEEPLSITITRATITIPTIDTKVEQGAHAAQGEDGDTTSPIQDGAFVISLYNFSAQSPSKFRAALREFVESDTTRLILDLRGNAGGYLQAAVDIASWFLPAGTPVVTEDFSNGEEDTVYRSKGYDIFNDNLEMAILVNRGSASAAEILAGALSEHGVATLVGETTFGKGSVQELINITPNASLKLTIAHWLTPNGKLISKGGITPDIEVEMTREDIEAGRNPQMERAIELLSEE